MLNKLEGFQHKRRAQVKKKCTHVSLMSNDACIWFCVHYLRNEAVQLSDTVLVRRVCGQPFRDGGLASQLIIDLHLLPKNCARPHVSTRLSETHTYLNKYT